MLAYGIVDVSRLVLASKKQRLIRLKKFSIPLFFFLNAISNALRDTFLYTGQLAGPEPSRLGSAR